jgi:hypothetical protein
VDVSLTSKDITVCAIQETWLDPAIDTVMTQGSAVGLLGTQLRLDPWRNRVPDQTRCHGLRYAAALKGQKFDHMGPIEEQVEAELACACQRVCALFRRRVAS